MPSRFSTWAMRPVLPAKEHDTTVDGHPSRWAAKSAGIMRQPMPFFLESDCVDVPSVETSPDFVASELTTAQVRATQHVDDINPDKPSTSDPTNGGQEGHKENKRLTRDQRRDILLMRRLGHTYEVIANFLGVTQAAVQYTVRLGRASPEHHRAGRPKGSRKVRGVTARTSKDRIDVNRTVDVAVENISSPDTGEHRAAGTTGSSSRAP